MTETSSGLSNRIRFKAVLRGRLFYRHLRSCLQQERPSGHSIWSNTILQTMRLFAKDPSARMSPGGRRSSILAMLVAPAVDRTILKRLAKSTIAGKEATSKQDIV